MAAKKKAAPRPLNKMGKLTPMQKKFVREYLIDLNATGAYRRCGYTARGNSAESCASRMLSMAKVKQAVDKAIEKQAKRTEITQDRVLKELARIAFFDIRKLYREDGSLKAAHELDDDAAAVLSGIDIVETTKGTGEEGAAVRFDYTKKTKTFDKNAALTLAMRHLGMLVDKTELTGKGGAALRETVLFYIPQNGRT